MELWNSQSGGSANTLAEVLAEEGAREKMLLWAQQDPLLLARLNAYLVEME